MIRSKPTKTRYTYSYTRAVLVVISRSPFLMSDSQDKNLFLHLILHFKGHRFNVSLCCLLVESQTLQCLYQSNAAPIYDVFLAIIIGQRRDWGS